MRKLLSGFLVVCLLFGVTAIVAGSILGQPVLLSHVTTGSMEPTISPDDGFVAIPSAVAGPIEEGDIVVYRAERLHGGGLTTHRVVGKTNGGYITRGDANPSTDQAGPEPPVREAQIVAKALQLDGHVVVIPHLGTLVIETQNLFGAVQQLFAGFFGLGGRTTVAVPILTASLLAYAWDLWSDRTTRTRTDKRSRDLGNDPRYVVIVLVGAVVIAATAAMVVPAGPTKYGFVSSSYDTPGASVIGAGQTEQTTYRTANPGVLPVTTFLEAPGDGIAISPTEAHVAPGNSVNATVTLTAPPKTGYYRRFVVEHRYLAILPTSTIRTLYRVHPWLPIAVIDALIGVPFYLLGIAVVGTGRIRTRSRSRGRSSLTRLRRALRGLY